MAEESERLIFPSVRISDLKKDVELKRLRLETSTQSLKYEAKESVNPLNILRKNPRLAAGALAAGVAILKTSASLFTKSKGGKTTGLNFKKLGFLSGAATMTGFWLNKFIVPIVSTLIQTSITDLIKQFRTKDKPE